MTPGEQPLLDLESLQFETAVEGESASLLWQLCVGCALQPARQVCYLAWHLGSSHCWTWSPCSLRLLSKVSLRYLSSSFHRINNAYFKIQDVSSTWHLGSSHCWTWSPCRLRLLSKVSQHDFSCFFFSFPFLWQLCVTCARLHVHQMSCSAWLLGSSHCWTWNPCSPRLLSKVSQPHIPDSCVSDVHGCMCTR